MAKKDLTIKEVKKKKADLEASFVTMIKEFENETGLKVGYFDVSRKRDNERDECCVPSSDIDRGPVTDVNISVDLDLFY